MRNLCMAVVFQLGWFACVLSGARGNFISAIAAASAVIAVNLWLQRERLMDEVRLIMWVTLVGFVVESINLTAGVFTLVSPSRYAWLCPVWLVLIWTMFATVLRGPLAWLSGRYRLSLLLGAIFAVPNYFAGARFGAVKLNSKVIYSVIVLMVLWAIAMPVMVWLSKTTDSSKQATS